MAFNFLGTLSLEGLNDLENFLTEEIELIDEQVNTLIVELDNLKRTKADLIVADENFGGKAVETLLETELPEIKNVPSQNDFNSSVLVEKIKRPFVLNIKYKRERLEYKIKKLLDVEEQTRELIDRKLIAKNQTQETISELRRLFNSINSKHLFQSEDDLNNFQRGVS